MDATKRARKARSAKSKRRESAAFAIGVELGSVESIEQLFKSLDAELTKRTGANRFDILVNNAGVAPDSSVATATEQTYDEVFALNTKVPFFVSQKALPRLRDGGRIINISSAVTRVAFPQKAAYAMTKGALNILTLELAKELGARNITVNSPRLVSQRPTWPPTFSAIRKAVNLRGLPPHLGESGNRTTLPMRPHFLHRMTADGSLGSTST